MHKIRSGSLIGFFTLAILLAMQTGAMADNYKCKSTDGRIEYSDRPCETHLATAAGDQRGDRAIQLAAQRNYACDQDGRG